MKILLINTNDGSGGAARAVCRLHTGLHRLDQDSTLFVARRNSNDVMVKAFSPTMDLFSRLRRRLYLEWINRNYTKYRSRPEGYELFSDARTQYGAAPLSQLPPCDVINLHWVAGFVDYEAFLDQIPKHIPIVWTLHDMNPFTGGCHYDHHCGRYRNRCGSCPQLASDDERDLSRRIWERKQRTFARIAPDRLHIVTPSHWLAREAGHSTLLGRFPISVIPNSLDTDVFVPREREMARAALEIPQEAAVLLFVSDWTGDRRKGFMLLAQALAGLSNLSDIFLLSLGKGEPDLEISIPHRHLGHLEDDRLMALVYSAADLFVIPSLQDNLPNTVLESLACGTPVVGFDVGGIPDMVRPGVTGLLAPIGDVDGLREAIVELLRNPAMRAEMTGNCRRIAVEEYALKVQARHYLQLYQSMLNQL